MIYNYVKSKVQTSCREFTSISPPTLKYAIIEVGGTQKIVEEGRYYSCNRLQADVGSKLRFGRVMAIKDTETIVYGTPWLPNSFVEAEILEAFKGRKIIVYKMKPKKHTRSKKGHRQSLTRFVVHTIRA
jgi:ribosomal protein L21